MAGEKLRAPGVDGTVEAAAGGEFPLRLGRQRLSFPSRERFSVGIRRVHDRMTPLTQGMQGMIDYVSPLVDERLVNPGDDFISVLATGEKKGVFTRHQVLVNTSLLLLAGH